MKGKRKEIGKGKREDEEKTTHKMGVKEKRWPRSKRQWEKDTVIKEAMQHWNCLAEACPLPVLCLTLLSALHFCKH